MSGKDCLKEHVVVAMKLFSGRSQTLNVNFEGTNWSVGHLSQAVYIALYSYDGG